MKNLIKKTPLAKKNVNWEKIGNPEAEATHGNIDLKLNQRKITDDEASPVEDDLTKSEVCDNVNLDKLYGQNNQLKSDLDEFIRES